MTSQSWASVGPPLLFLGKLPKSPSTVPYCSRRGTPYDAPLPTSVGSNFRPPQSDLGGTGNEDHPSLGPSWTPSPPREGDRSGNIPQGTRLRQDLEGRVLLREWSSSGGDRVPTVLSHLPLDYSVSVQGRRRFSGLVPSPFSAHLIRTRTISA